MLQEADQKGDREAVDRLKHELKKKTSKKRSYERHITAEEEKIQK